MVESFMNSLVSIVSKGLLFILWWFLLSCSINALVEWGLRPTEYRTLPYIKWTRLTCVVVVPLLLLWKICW